MNSNATAKNLELPKNPNENMETRCFTGALVWTGRRSDSGFAPRDILVKDGHIVQVAEHIDVHTVGTDIAVTDLSGFRVTPGLIDAHTHIGVSPEDFPYSMDDCNEMTDPITPELRALDAIYSQDTALPDALEGGITCLQALPGSANVIGGQGAIIKTRPDIVERMAIVPCSAMKAAFGENPVSVYAPQHKMPMTRMGIAALMRGALVKAQNYMAKQEAQSKKENNDEFFERDLKMEALAAVLRREIPIRFHAHRVDDIQTGVRIATEFNLKYSIEHCTEGHFIASWLAEKNVFAAVGPTITGRCKIEVRNKSWETPVALWKAGVHFCLITDHPVIPIEHLVLDAALATKAGLPEDEALRAITLYAAEHLGIENRVGSLEAGKDADIVIWNGDPMDARTHVAATIIDGKVAWQKK